MPVKQVEIPELGIVSLYKRSGVRSLRLTIGPDGMVRITLPKWSPYKLGIDFAVSRQEWIVNHRPAPRQLLQDGDHIGKAHRLFFEASASSSKISTRVAKNEIRVTYPQNIKIEDEAVQKVAIKACTRALKQQAEQLLPLRVRQLAVQYGFSYKSIRIKQLRSRWGSCNNIQELVFSLYLMQLPWRLIDYVILHELQHTTVLRHGPQFWRSMSTHRPDIAELRRAIRHEQPVLKPHRP